MYSKRKQIPYGVISQPVELTNITGLETHGAASSPDCDVMTMICKTAHLCHHQTEELHEMALWMMTVRLLQRGVMKY